MCRYECRVCSTAYGSEEEYHSHVQGEEHKSNWAEMQAMQQDEELGRAGREAYEEKMAMECHNVELERERALETMDAYRDPHFHEMDIGRYSFKINIFHTKILVCY